MLLSRMSCPAATALDTKCSHVRSKIGSETFNSHCHTSKLEPQSMSSLGHAPMDTDVKATSKAASSIFHSAREQMRADGTLDAI